MKIAQILFLIFGLSASASDTCSWLLGENQIFIQHVNEILQRDTSGKKLRIVISTEFTPKIQIDKTSKTLFFPSNISPPDFLVSLKKLLVGHRLHPLIEGSASEREDRAKLFTKQFVHFNQTDQSKAIKAYTSAVLEGDRSFLYVAPMASDRIQFLGTILKKRWSSSGIHIVVAGKLKDADRLAQGFIRSLKSSFEIVQWEANGSKQPSLQSLLTSITSPTIVVTTLLNLELRYKEWLETHPPEEFLEHLSTLAIYESHSTGSGNTDKLIANLLNQTSSKTFLVGTTPTPLHPKFSNIKKTFEDRFFWSGVDNSKPLTLFSKTLEQLNYFIHQGELTPIQDLVLIGPKNFDMENFGSFYISEKKGSGEISKERFSINPNAYSKLAAVLSPFFEKHQFGFIRTNTNEEANALANFLNQNQSLHKRFLAHSFKTEFDHNNSILEQLRYNKVNYIISADFPDREFNFPMDIVIDLHRQINVRRLIQMITPLFGLAVGKESIDIVLLTDPSLQTRSTLEDLIEFSQKFRAGLFSGSGIYKNSQHEDAASATDLDERIVESIAYLRNKNLSSTGDLEQLDSYILRFESLPLSWAEDVTQRGFIKWFLNYKKENPGNWFMSLSPAAYQILKDKNLLPLQQKSDEQWIKDFSQFLILKNRLPSKKSVEPYEVELANWFQFFKKRFPESWFEMLPRETQKIVETKKSISHKTKEQRALELSQFIEDNKKEPSKHSEDLKERTLARFLERLRLQFPFNWIDNLSVPAAQILKNQDSFEKVNLKNDEKKRDYEQFLKRYQKFL